MIARLTLLLCVTLAVTLAGCGEDEPSAGSADAPGREVVVRAGDRSVTATPFGACVTRTTGDRERIGSCPAVALDEVPTPRLLPVVPEQRLTILVAPAASALAVRLHGHARAEGRTALRPAAQLDAEGDGGRWQVRLPEALPMRARLEIVPMKAGRTDGGHLAALAPQRQEARPPGPRRGPGPLLCPQPGPANPAPERRLDARELVGLSEAEARERAAGYGCTVRVGRRNGESLFGTRDLRPDRIDVAVEDERVTEILGIG